MLHLLNQVSEHLIDSPFRRVDQRVRSPQILRASEFAESILFRVDKDQANRIWRVCDHEARDRGTQPLGLAAPRNTSDQQVRHVLCEIDEFDPPCQVDPCKQTRIAIVAPFGAQTVAQFTKQYKFPVFPLNVDSDAATRATDHWLLVKPQANLQISSLTFNPLRRNAAPRFKQISNECGAD